MKHKKYVKILLVVLICIFFWQTKVFATTLKLKVLTDKDKYELNERVCATVDWTEKMQAASFTIQYDPQKLQFESSNIPDTFYNKQEEGKISVNWVSMEEKDFTKMQFDFKTLKSGIANISIKEVGGFADSNIKEPDRYEYKEMGTKNIAINYDENINDINIESNKTDKNTGYHQNLPQTGIENSFMVGLLSSIGLVSICTLLKLKSMPKF